MNNFSLLIVDDEKLILEGTQFALERCGYKIDAASNGEDAVAKLNNTKYDLILTDLVLPDINGIDILHRTKQISPDTSVIIITGYADLATAVQALQLGADDYILKPCDIGELQLRVDKCLVKAEAIKSLKMHHKIVASTSDNLVMVSPDYKHIIVNESYRKTFDLKTTDIYDLRLAEVFGADFFATEMEKNLKSCLAGQGINHRTFFPVNGHNSPRFLHFSYSPYKDDDGRVTYIIINIRDVTEHDKMINELKEVSSRLRLALDVSSDGVWDRDILTNETYYGDNWARLLGYSIDEVREQNLKFTELLHPDDKDRVLNLVQNHFDMLTDRYMAEFRLRKKNGDWQWILSRGKVVERDEAGRPLRFVGTHTDIDRQKGAELALRHSKEKLEDLVEKRTRQLSDKSENLEEMNSALTVLLKKREQDKMALEEQMVANIKVLVAPYLEKIKKTPLSNSQKTCIDIIETNLHNVVSPFLYRLSTQNLCFTPTEIQVANFIKDGRTSKEIAQIMNLSPETISNHRKHIRKKSGIANKKVNLRTVLDTFAQK